MTWHMDDAAGLRPACFGLAVALLLGGCGLLDDASNSVDVASLGADSGPTAIAPASPGFVEEGQASWYGAELAGARTASGEPFDPAALTAAHPELPFGTSATVTNLANGQAIVVVINDRGPAEPHRIIDVSQAAAQALGFMEGGTAQVRIEVTPEALAAARAGES